MIKTIKHKLQIMSKWFENVKKIYSVMLLSNFQTLGKPQNIKSAYGFTEKLNLIYLVLTTFENDIEFKYEK